ncbi:amidohydrolase family protein [Streptomyces sp. TS71-3]|uniref:amidohydrolase family protein n=1 Tax=Streptomyces sp. TS71-3 TaxID=2733862 RepID=UPI001B24045C|nr:amidohydrolase family protein [Streptomyces sp. TS71-3]GHJ38482.1 TRZ/ATZ family hydrolase [Streptomyces sp. TS71-3]
MSDTLLIRGGTVMTVDPHLGDIDTGDVLVEDGRISAVGKDLRADGARLIDASDMIVMPGLVDSHRHLWQSSLHQIAADWTLEQYAERMLGLIGPRFSAEDVHIGNLLGALEALGGGVTTVMDWSHIMNTPEHADAAVQALTDAGIRAVFGYGSPSSPVNTWYEQDVERVAATYFATPDRLLTLALASLGPEFSSLEQTAADIALARRLGVRTSLHVGAGALGAVRAVTRMDEAGLLGPDLIHVHCSTCTDDELRRIARSGGHVSVSPRVEMQMGHGYPATGRLLAAGIGPSLSIDVVSAVGGSMFAEMRGTLEAERGLRNQRALDRGERITELVPTTADVVRMATIEGARTLGLEDRIGSLTPGKQADIVLLRVDLPNLGPVNNLPAAVTLAAGDNVDTVLVAGRVVKAEGRLLGQDTRALHDRACSSRDRVLAGSPFAVVPAV